MKWIALLLMVTFAQGSLVSQKPERLYKKSFFVWHVTEIWAEREIDGRIAVWMQRGKISKKDIRKIKRSIEYNEKEKEFHAKAVVYLKQK